MTYVEPAKPRYTLTDSFGQLTIAVPSRKNWFMILFLGFWLIGWAVGEIAVPALFLPALLSPPAGEHQLGSSGPGVFLVVFLLAWLGGWTVGGVMAIRQWLWNLKGVEIVTLDGESLSIRRRSVGRGREKRYALAEVSALRVSVPAYDPSNPWGMQGATKWWSRSGGIMAFDYGASTVRFGQGLEEAEAKKLLAEIAQRFPKIVQEKGP